ncbi:MAG: malonate transporter [Phenylobacterium sp.]|jgi:malonate transporter
MTTFTIIFPIIFVVAAGYLVARSQFLSESQISGLSRLTFSLIMPIFLFINMATADLDNIFNFKLFATFYLPVVLIYGLSMLWHYFYAAEQSHQFAPASVFALATGYSNLVLVGLPITIAALGEQALGPVFMLISFHGVTLFGSTIVLCAIGSGERFSALDTLKKVCSNPIVGSIWLGLGINFIGLRLPEVLITSLRFLAKPGITLALIVLGTALHAYSVKGKIGQIGAVTVIKLLVFPLLVWWFAGIFGLSQQLTTIAVLLSASPTGVNAYLIATGQECHEALIASTVVVSTVLCVVTFSGWLAVLL